MTADTVTPGGPARRPRRRNPRAGRHLADVAAGDATLIRFATAPLPPGVDVDPFDTCDCDYRPPIVNGKPAPHTADPAWTDWAEDPPLGDRPRTKRYLSREIKLMIWGGKRGRVVVPPLYPLPGFHSGDPRHEKPGFPDFFLWSPATPGRPKVREAKRMGRSPDIAQATHMTTMRLAGMDVGLWRTCCLLSGRISRELADFAGVPLHPGDEFAPRLGKATGDDWLIGPPTVPVPAAARRARAREVADQLAPRAVAQVRPAGVLPGTVPPAGEPGRAVGYIVGVLSRGDGDQADNDALHAWLRACGLALSDVPYPILIVVGQETVRVSVRPAGPDRARVWRAFTPPTAFPHTAARRLATIDGDVVPAPSPELAATLIRKYPGNVDVPAKTGVAP